MVVMPLPARKISMRRSAAPGNVGPQSSPVRLRSVRVGSPVACSAARASIAAHNHGEGNILRNIRSGRDVDSGTAHNDYSADMLARADADGEVMITDGPYLEAKEHVGGFWILNAADMDEAVAWGRKAVAACRASVEVREFYAMPPE